MKLRLGIFVLVVGILLICPAMASDNSFSEFLQSKLPQWKDLHRVPVVSVGVIDNCTLSWNVTLGGNHNQVFQLGSISKSVAAWGVMTLVRDGLLRLDDPVEPFLNWSIPIRVPGVADTSQVTIRSLLSHTAGISLPFYPGFDPSTSPLPSTLQSLQGATNGVGDVYVEYIPGTRFVYSGGGFTILQRLTEQVTGMAFADYIQSAVLGPLGMSQSGYEWTGELQAETVPPFDVLTRQLPNYLFAAKAAAGLYSNVADLALFATAVLADPTQGLPAGRGVLPSALVSELLVAPPANPEGSYGLGYQLWQEDSMFLVGHSGATRGWRSVFYVAPDTGAGLVVLTDSDSGTFLMKLLQCEHLAYMEGRPLGHCLIFTPEQIGLASAACLLVFLALAAVVRSLVLLLIGWRHLSLLPRRTAGDKVIVVGGTVFLAAATVVCWVVLFAPILPGAQGYIAQAFGAPSLWLCAAVTFAFAIALLHALFVTSARSADDSQSPYEEVHSGAPF